MTIELELPSTVKQVRIDPAMLPCITTIKEVVLNGEALPIVEPKCIVVNGKESTKNIYTNERIQNDEAVSCKQ